MAAIKAVDLKKTYPKGVEALRGVSFEVKRGEIFGLLGPNGAGKSTTIRILTTLSHCTSGKAFVSGINVAERPQEVRRQIGYVAQAAGVDVLATGRENLMLQGRLFHLPGRELKRRVDELLDLLQLTPAAERLVQTYSGGMKRRLDVAMGLVHRPKVLFLDEPTTGLDLESRSVMWQEVRRLAREDELTILLTTHYLEEADQLAQRLAIIDKGLVVARGTPDELKGALRGDVISIQLAEEARLPEAKSLLEELGEVSNVMVDRATLYARVAHGASAIPPLVAALEGAGLRVSQVSLSRPSLDDVYLSATGHSFSESDAIGSKNGKETA